MSDTRRPCLLLIDDDEVIRDSLEFVLADEFEVHTAESRNEARQLLGELKRAPDLCLLDLGLPPRAHLPDEGFALVPDLLAASPSIKILVLSGQDSERNVRHALTLGAFDFLAKPCDAQELKERLRQALLISDAEQSGDQPVIADDFGILGNSVAVANTRAQAEQFADLPFAVLVEGESGSGKELVCRALHDASQRRAEPFLVLNCAAISSQLIEAQLFGNAKGAFTGANTSRTGFFEDVGNGTLCLDEIGEMPMDLQAKLLRVLENGEYYRLGETRVRTANARIIAATNRNLKREVAAGRFREDLYHRLSVFRIKVPPLRQREGDRRLLGDHFASFYSSQLKSPAFRFDTDAADLWDRYPFPGNVRELKNIVIRLCTRFPGQTVTMEQLRAELEADNSLPQMPALNRAQFSAASPSHAPLSVPAADDDAGPINTAAIRAQLRSSADFNLDEQLRQWEQQFIEAALEETGGNLSKASKLLGVNRTTLYSRMQKFSQDEPEN